MDEAESVATEVPSDHLQGRFVASRLVDVDGQLGAESMSVRSSATAFLGVVFGAIKGIENLIELALAALAITTCTTILCHWKGQLGFS